MFLFFFKQKTAYEMRISDWSSDVCSSDLVDAHHRRADARARDDRLVVALEAAGIMADVGRGAAHVEADQARLAQGCGAADHADDAPRGAGEDRIAAVEGGGGGEAARAFPVLRVDAVPELGEGLIARVAEDGRETGGGACCVAEAVQLGHCRDDAGG